MSRRAWGLLSLDTGGFAILRAVTAVSLVPISVHYERIGTYTRHGVKLPKIIKIKIKMATLHPEVSAVSDCDWFLSIVIG